MDNPVDGLASYIYTTLALFGRDPHEAQPRRLLQAIALAWANELLRQDRGE